MAHLKEYLETTFGVKRLADVHWSHAVNSTEKLNRMIDNPQIMIIESDIRLSKAGDIVCAHPPETESDLTIDTLLQQIARTNTALKLDFKDPETVDPTLQRIRSARIEERTIVNADILQGNLAPPSKFHPQEFIDLFQRHTPLSMISLGWTTTLDPMKPYTEKNINDMLQYAKRFSDVTFPVRACLLPYSAQPLIRLLQSNPTWSLSIWNNEPVSESEQTWIKDHMDPKRTFYDFIDDQKEPLIFAWQHNPQ